MSGSLPPQTVDEALRALERLGNEKVRQIQARHGAPENQFGVKLGDIRGVAKGIKVNHPLGLELWATGNAEAMLLATLIVDPKRLSDEELEEMTASVSCAQLAEWLMSYVTRQHPHKEQMRRRWMESSHPWLARAGWSLTEERIRRSPEGLDTGALLDRIDREMAGAPAPTRWTMNFCLGAIGIEFAEHRERAIGIGERIGLYRDYPVSKGCVTPFVPIWIRAIVSRSA